MKKLTTLVLSLILGMTALAAGAEDGIFPPHEPYGRGVGVMPGRVVWAHEPDSVNWDGSGYWWEIEHFDEAVIQKMVDSSVAALAGASTAAQGWEALFTDINERRNRSGGYKAGEKVAIKANINGSAVMDDDTSGETKMSYTNPVLLKTLLLSLVNEAGVSPESITVYDVSRLFPDYMVEMCSEGVLSGVKFVTRDNGVADENAPIVWSHEFSGKVNYLPTCVTEAAYVVNLANLKGHSYGVTLCGKNHFGSFINGNAMRPPEGANLHQWLTKSEMGIYSPLVDLMANADLGGKTVLYMLDALICAPSEGASITGSNSRWRQAPFNKDYTSSIFVSQDPVAIDSVGADFLVNEPAVTDNNSAVSDRTVENYLHEAGLVGNSPSGTVYTDGNGHIVTNLGVHEHWNNQSAKQYSRNLGKSEGIELVMTDVDEPEITIENQTVKGKNIPNGSSLITIFYENGEVSRVRLYRPSEGLIEADLSAELADADAFKAFLWDMSAIRPLALPLEKTAEEPAPQPEPEVSKTLVAYFSCTGSTEGVADRIAHMTGADKYEIVPEIPYTEEDLAYYTDCRADREQSDPTARPKIAGSVDNMDDYDVIFLGYPIWHGQAPKIIYTFLESYDLSGKIIIPFCTSHSSGIGSSADNLHSLAPDADWRSGRRFGGGAAASEVESWLSGLELN